MKISLGYSPCPNDTFIFDAIKHKKIDLMGLDFDIILGDVEELNRLAFAQKLDVTKLSYHAFAHLLPHYALLNSGSALGNNCGPLLIAKQPLSVEQINEATIAIPGKYTTANFLLANAYPAATHKIETLFSDIEQDVLSGKVDAGLIIHENRFTYHEKGLVKIADLGEVWEQQTGLPIPLGGIVVNRHLPKDIQQKINQVLTNSVQYAMDNPSSALPYIKQHAQEMDEEVMYAHIKLYVNDFTLDLGDKGRAAIKKMFDNAIKKGIIEKSEWDIFV